MPVIRKTPFIYKYWMTTLVLVVLVVMSVIRLPEGVRQATIFDYEISLDKWHHAIAYFVFTFIMAIEMKKNNSKLRSIIVAAALSLLVGVLLEIVQYALPYRTFNVNDIVANGIGVVFALVFFSLIYSTKINKQ